MAVSRVGLALCLLVVPVAQGMVIFDELSKGDLSNDPGLPTLMTVGLGSSVVSATVSSRDRDYFTLRLPQGAALSGVWLRRSDGVEATFVGVQAGAVFTEPPESADLRRTLGYTEFFAPDVNTDLLAKLADAPGAIGFAGLLMVGDFTFWVEQKNTSPALYEFEFVIVQIPSPGGWGVVLAGVGIGCGIRRRRAGMGRNAERVWNPFCC